jgi:hypothetical protein
VPGIVAFINNDINQLIFLSFLWLYPNNLSLQFTKYLRQKPFAGVRKTLASARNILASVQNKLASEHSHARAKAYCNHEGHDPWHTLQKMIIFESILTTFEVSSIL